MKWIKKIDYTRDQMICGEQSERVDPLTDKLFNWNFHPLEVVSR